VIGGLVDTATDVMSSPWVYLLIVLVALADALAPVVPSETVVITAAVFAASGTTDVPLVVITAAAGAMIGDHLSYLIGRMTSRWTAGGDPAGRRARMMRRAGSLLADRGGMALVVARYIPGGRTAVTLGMGALRHPLGSFTGWDAIAAVSWAGYCTALGVVGGSAFAEDPLPAVLLGTTIALVIAGLAEVTRQVRRRRQRRRSAPTTAASDAVHGDDVVADLPLPSAGTGGMTPGPRPGFEATR